MKQETYDATINELKGKYLICNAMTRHIVGLLAPEFNDPCLNPLYPVIYKDILNELTKAFSVSDLKEVIKAVQK